MTRTDKNKHKTNITTATEFASKDLRGITYRVYAHNTLGLIFREMKNTFWDSTDMRELAVWLNTRASMLDGGKKQFKAIEGAEVIDVEPGEGYEESTETA